MSEYRKKCIKAPPCIIRIPASSRSPLCNEVEKIRTYGVLIQFYGIKISPNPHFFINNKISNLRIFRRSQPQLPKDSCGSPRFPYLWRVFPRRDTRALSGSSTIWWSSWWNEATKSGHTVKQSKSWYKFL